MELEALNALFVIGRSIGIVGHILDQRRMEQGLYRYPNGDIFIKIEPSGLVLDPIHCGKLEVYQL